MNPLEYYRSQFDSLKHCHHMISNSLGAMPNAAHEAAAEYAHVWADRGVRAWAETWWMLAHEVGNKIGRLMNAPVDTVSVHTNVTSAEAAVLSCFDFSGRRNKVVMVEMEFPSVKYIYTEWVNKHGGRVQRIPCPDGVTIPTEQVVDAIDEETLLVPISHVLFRSSYIVDAKAMIEKAQRVGARVVLDVYQSLGSIPVDICELGADFAVGGCLKWLCGGPGTSFLYVREDLINELEPVYTGWLAHEAPFLFAESPIKRTNGAYRFLNGTPGVPAMYMARPGLDIVSEIGVERIRERSVEMTERILEAAADRNWKTTTPKKVEERAGTVAIDFPDGAAIASELNARDFLCDYRPKAGVRLSPHFYNTDQEIDETIAEIEKILADGSYKKHLEKQRLVT